MKTDKFILEGGVSYEDGKYVEFHVARPNTAHQRSRGVANEFYEANEPIIKDRAVEVSSTEIKKPKKADIVNAIKGSYDFFTDEQKGQADEVLSNATSTVDKLIALAYSLGIKIPITLTKNALAARIKQRKKIAKKYERNKKKMDG